MICPACGTENPNKFKFCVKCGSNLENPQEVNIEQVDLGGYHSEEDYDSNKTGFKMSTGTFTISDSAPASNTSDLYTADELNDDDEEFDFSSYDEPFIPKLDADRLAVPHNNPMPMQQPVMGQPMMYGQQPVMGGMPAQQPVMGQQGMPQQGMPQQGIPQSSVYGQPQPMMYAQPQLLGYDQNGMPIYGQPQPMMYGQPQLIGYDQNGMPIYGQPQPMMYGQPQLLGYDQNGMPIYGQPQPMMYGQQPGMPAEGGAPVQQPVMGQPMMYGQQPVMGGMPGMPGMPQPGVYGAPQQQTPPPQQSKKDDRVKMSDDFWEFFDGGKATEHKEDTMDDFFGKRSDDMGGVSLSGLDMSRLQRQEQKRNSYMNDTPLVNADDLAPNLDDKFNKLYMRKTDYVDASELAAKEDKRPQDIMGVTRDVDISKLSQNEHIRSRVSMSGAGEANADDLEVYVREHKEASMDQALEAVEALPTKKKTYNDEIDAIELPEYMQARKTVKNDTPEIPGLPEI